MTVRKLTISCMGEPPYKPFIRLHGKWLAEAGFKINHKVRVHVELNRITITPEPQTQENDDV